MEVAFPKPDIGIHVFIDEAGDLGIRPATKVSEPKGSSWLIIGAVAVSSKNHSQIPSWLNSIKAACGIPATRAIHYVKLDREKRQIACKMLSELPIRCFAFCSNKKNIRGYSNPRAAEKSNEKNFFFHSCVKYLLERVTEFAHHQSIKEHGKERHLAITFDRNDMVPFSKLRTYLISECRRIEAGLEFQSRRPMKTTVVNAGTISAAKDEDCLGLQLADLVAGAFHDCTENALTDSKFNIGPAKELKKVMWKGIEPSRLVANNGLTLFPPYRDEIFQLSFKEKEIFEFYGYWLN